MTTPTRREWDAVVVGGGPAGSVTASLLAKMGHRVVLLERATFPRPKPCGESINPGAVRELAELDLLPLVQALPHRPIGGWTVFPISKQAFRGRYPPDRRGMAVERSVFDAALLRHAREAGVDVQERVQVADLVSSRGRVVGVDTRGGRRYCGTLVMGCDGLRSIVARRAGLLLRAPRLRKIAITGHVRGAALSDGAGELRFLPWGTAGIVGITADLANVVLVLGGTFRRDGRSLESWFDRLIADVPSLNHAMRVGRVHATGPFDCPTRRVAAEGILLIGDAAGYFDPFTGQGIYRALKGARLAAGAAERVLGDPGAEKEALRDYAVGHNIAFRPGQLLQRVIEDVTRRPTPFDYAAKGLARFPAVADFIVRMTGDVPPPSH